MKYRRPRGNRYRRAIIAPSAIKRFVGRKLDDYQWLKRAPSNEVFDALSWNNFITSPRPHQIVCSLIGQNEPRFLFFLNVGAGKTKIILDLIRYRKAMGQLQAALVCVPNLINLTTWERQIEKHAPDLSVTLLEGTRSDRFELIEQETDVYIINYAGLPVYMTHIERNKDKQQGQRVVVGANVEAFGSLFNFLCLDEIHLMGDHTTLSFRLAHQLSASADFAYALTATPFGRDPTRMWSEFKIIDNGETLGQTLGLYRATFFKEVEDYWAGVKYTFDKRKQLLLHHMIQHKSLRYGAKEIGGMPKVQKQTLEVRLSQQQREYYSGINDQIRKADRDITALTNTYIRSRQTTAGFIAIRGDTVQLEVQFEQNAKLDGLAAFIDQLPVKEKLVIFHVYIYSGVMIQEMLRKKHIGYSGVGHGFKQPHLQLKRFLTDRKTRVFLSNVAAGGTGVDGLQDVSRYGIFYESPSSPTTRTQCEGRLARPGSKETVFLFDLACTDTVDTKILRYLEEGKDLFEAVCEGKVKRL